jgi:ribosomal protein S18 acetylase RimI-like enzyme/protein-L-isoaspartate O-methyltransferase
VSDPRRQRARDLAADAVVAGDAVGWFEQLYREAATGTAIVPWADREPNPQLMEWLAAQDGPWGRVLVVGCGFGDDAEHLAAAEAGEVVAFDVSPTAIVEARRRFPDSRVTYVVQDALALPDGWRGGFDLVVEINTLQVLPSDHREPLVAGLAACLEPDGTLLMICRGREDSEPVGELPWPLTRAELDLLISCGLVCEGVVDKVDDETPPVRRFVATLRRPVQVQLRRYVAADHADVRALHHLALRDVQADAGPGPWDDDLDAIEAVYLDGSGEFLVGVIDGRMLAMGALLRRSDDVGEIKRMRVHPDLQRRGIGRRLLGELEERAGRLGYRKLVLDTTAQQHGAQRLYESFGYIRVGQERVGDFVVYRYEKELRP